MGDDTKRPSELVEYRCVADGHAPRALLSPDFALRVHLRAWAFCPAGERSGHRWERIDGAPVETLLAAAADGGPAHAGAGEVTAPAAD